MSNADLTLSTLFRAEIAGYLKNVRTLKQQIRELAGLTSRVGAMSKQASSGVGQLERSMSKSQAAIAGGAKGASVYQRELGKLNQKSAALGESFRKMTNRGKLSDNVMMQMSSNLQRYHGNIKKASQSFGSYLNSMRKTRAGTQAATSAMSRFNQATQQQANIQKAAWGVLDTSQKGLTRYFSSVGRGNELLRTYAGVTKQASAAQNRYSRRVQSLHKAYDNGLISLQQMVTQNSRLQASMSKVAKNTGQVVAARKKSLGTIKQSAAYAKGLNLQYDKGNVSLQSMIQSHSRWQAAQKKTTSAQAAATRQVKRTTGAIKQSHDQLYAHGKQLSRIEGGWNRLKAAARVTAAYGVAATSIYAMVGAARTGVVTIAEFDQSLKNLEAITGASAVQLEGMGDKMLEVARRTKFSVAEIAEGMRLLGQAGFSAEEALDAIDAVANLATGTLSSLETTSDLLTSAIRAFGLEAKEAGRVSDVMANSINNSKLTIDKLRIAFNFVGASASQAGLSLEETAAGMQILANSGLRASTIGTGFRQVLAKLLSPSRALREEFERHGVAIESIDLSDFQGTMESLTKVLWDQERGMVDMSKAYDLFKLRGAQAAAVLIRGFASGEFQQVIKNTYEVGAAAEMATIQQEGLVVKWKNLSDRAKNLAQALGDVGLTGALKVFVDALRNSVTAMEAFARSGIGSTIIQLTAMTAAIVGVTRGLRVLLAVAGKSIALEALAVTMKNLQLAYIGLSGRAMTAAAGMKHLGWALTGLFSPLTLAVTAITGMGIALYKLDKYHQNAARAAAKSAMEHGKTIESMDSLAKIAEGAANNHQKYVSILQRYKQENPEVARRMAELSHNVDITTMSFDELAGAIEKVKLEQLKGQVASFGEQFGHLEDDTYRFKTMAERVSDVLTFNWVTAVKDAWKSTFGYEETLEDINASLDLQIAVMGDAASRLARYAFATGKSEEEMGAFIDTMAAAGKISEKFANRLKAWLGVAMEEMAEQQQRVKESIQDVIDMGPQYEAFYKNLSSLQKAHFAKTMDQIEKEISAYKRRKDQLNLNDQQIKAATTAIRAKNLADFVAEKNSQIDTEAEAAQRRIAIIESIFDAEIQGTREASEAREELILQKEALIRQQQVYIAREAIDLEKEKISDLADFRVNEYQRSLDKQLGRLSGHLTDLEQKDKDSLGKQYDAAKAYTEDLVDIHDQATGQLKAIHNKATGEIVQIEYDAAGQIVRAWGDVTDIKAKQEKQASSKIVDAIRASLNKQMGEYETQYDTLKRMIEEKYGDSADVAEEKNEQMLRADKELVEQKIKLHESAIGKIRQILSSTADEEASAEQERAELRAKRLDTEGKEYLKISSKIGQYEKKIRRVSTAKKALLQYLESEKKKREELIGQKFEYEADLRLNNKPPEEAIKSMKEIVSELLESIQEAAQSHMAHLGIEVTGQGLLDDLTVGIEKLLGFDGKEIEIKAKVSGSQNRRWGGPIVDRVRQLAAGAPIPGYGGGDKVDAKLEPGEWVIRKEAVAKYGHAFFDALNRMRLNIPDIGASIQRRLGGPIQVPQIRIPKPAFQSGGAVGGFENMGVLNLQIDGRDVGPIYGKPDVLGELGRQVKRKQRLRSNQ